MYLGRNYIILVSIKLLLKKKQENVFNGVLRLIMTLRKFSLLNLFERLFELNIVIVKDNFIFYYCTNMDRKEKIIRLISRPAEGKYVREEGIGQLTSHGCHQLRTTFFIQMESTTMIFRLSAHTLMR
jgi:hypothetical protein